MNIAAALGLMCVGLACLVGIVIPVPAERGVALRVVLGILAVIFFLIAAGFAFGWIRA